MLGKDGMGYPVHKLVGELSSTVDNDIRDLKRALMIWRYYKMTG